jgi:hypothetical protein
MKINALRIAVKCLVGLVVLICLGIFFGISWVNKNLESILNSNPDRKYNINFEMVDFDYLRRIIQISAVKITPVGDQEGVFVRGEVEQISLNKLNVAQLVLNKKLKIKEFVFSNPELTLFVPTQSADEDRSGDGLKGFFGDVLSRGEIRNFEVNKAHLMIILDDNQIGNVSNLNILATGLETDSLKIANPIPFDYERIVMTVDSMSHKLANGERFKAGKISFDTDLQELSFEGLSLKYPDGLVGAASKMDYQIDMIEFDLDSMKFSGLEATSNLYSNPDVRAQKLELSGLLLRDLRNKNLPRPHDDIKPLFQGMVNSIPFPLKLDTLRVANSTIIYSEIVPDSDDVWEFHLDHLNGQFVNITTIPEYQSRMEIFEGDFTAKISGGGSMIIDFDIPYAREEFKLNVELTDFPLPKINDILNPILNGEIVAGDLHRLYLEMRADSLKSTNRLTFDYTGLKFNLFKKDSREKNKLMSGVANILLKESNMPGENKYTLPEYVTVHNRLRGPFHLIWNSTKDGLMLTIPGAAARTIISPGGN